MEGAVDCREAKGLLDKYYDRELEPAASMSVHDHVDMCGACRQRLANLELIGRMIRRAPYYQPPDALRKRIAQARTRSTV
jgi:predicted anti-sigma-YlaC factor YlaD